MLFRSALADQLLEKGLVDAKKYLQVVETGAIDDMLDAPRQSVLLIKDENESMMEGKEPIAIVSDDHEVHIREHLTLLATTESRNDPALVKRVLAHVEEHKNLLQTGDPFLLSLTQSNYKPAVQAPQAPVQSDQVEMNPVPPAQPV